LYIHRLSGQRGNFLTDMSSWLEQRFVIPDETFFQGVDEWPTAFNSLFTNCDRKRGKVVVRVSAEDCNEEVV
jgi:NADPH-dependent curcumin reductase CurA